MPARAAAIALVAALVMVLVVPVGAWPLAYVSVRGDSMEPTISSGDVVVLLARNEYRVGDVVAYRVPEMGDAVILHRIVDRIAESDEHVGGSRVVMRSVLRGDNNTFTDRHRPTDADIVGRSAVTVRPPWATALVSPTLRAGAIGVVVAAAATALRRRRRRRRRRRERPRTEAGVGWTAGRSDVVAVTRP